MLLHFSVTWSQQSKLIISGKVLDAKTRSPLSHATIKVKAQSIEVISNSDGSFELRTSTDLKMDTLEISHIGYITYKKILDDIHTPATILLEDYSIQLKTLTITSRE